MENLTRMEPFDTLRINCHKSPIPAAKAGHQINPKNSKFQIATIRKSILNFKPVGIWHCSFLEFNHHRLSFLSILKKLPFLGRGKAHYHLLWRTTMLG